jgi:hypothetical protein
VALFSDLKKLIYIFRDRIGKLLSDAGVPFNPRSDYLQALTRRWRQVQTFFSFQKDLNYFVLGNTYPGFFGLLILCTL